MHVHHDVCHKVSVCSYMYSNGNGQTGWLPCWTNYMKEQRSHSGVESVQCITMHFFVSTMYQAAIRQINGCSSSGILLEILKQLC